MSAQKDLLVLNEFGDFARVTKLQEVTPPQSTLDAAQADPTFQELPEPEQEAAGRFLERVDEPELAQMKTGQSLDTLAVNFNMARTDGETDAQLQKRIRTTMATNKRVIA